MQRFAATGSAAPFVERCSEKRSVAQQGALFAFRFCETIRRSLTGSEPSALWAFSVRPRSGALERAGAGEGALWAFSARALGCSIWRSNGEHRRRLGPDR